MKLILSIVIAMLAVAPLQAQDMVKTNFSVFYWHTQKDTNDFQSLEEIHYSYGKVDVPIKISAFRQTMLYPYMGSNKFALYKLVTKDGEEVRVPIATTSIPLRAQFGVIILIKDSATGKFKISPYWFKVGEMKEGARFVNLCESQLQLYIDRKNPTVIKPSAYIDLKPSIVGIGPTYVKLEGFIMKQKGGKPKKVKTLDRNPALMKDKPMVLLAYQKSQLSTTLKTLRIHGQPNTNRRLELYGLLPHLKPKEKPVGQGGHEADEGLPDWARDNDVKKKPASKTKDTPAIE
ncbi:MAG: hypothetical protein QNL01_08670 [Akkermansiaceae bacterium]